MQDLPIQDLPMSDSDQGPLDPLILDLVEWIARAPRSHADVMDAWRTSCPRLTVWEDAVDRGFVTRKPGGWVEPTDAGRAFLQQNGRFVVLT